MSSTGYFFLGIASLLSSGTLIIPSSASPQFSEALIPKKDIFAMINHPVTISCLSRDDSPLNSCRWELRSPMTGKRYNLDITTTTTPNNASQSLVDNPPGLDCNCTYEYAGTGLEKGDCSITIRNVSQFHVANWDCLMWGTKGEEAYRHRMEFELSLGGSMEVPVNITTEEENESFWIRIMMLLIILGAGIILLWFWWFTKNVICVAIRGKRNRKGDYPPPQQLTINNAEQQSKK